MSQKIAASNVYIVINPKNVIINIVKSFSGNKERQKDLWVKDFSFGMVLKVSQNN